MSTIYSIARFVDVTSMDFTSHSFTMPMMFTDTLTTLNTVRTGWGWYRDCSIYTNKSNLVKLGIGHAFNKAEPILRWTGFSNLNAGVKIAAVFVLATSRIIDLSHKKQEWSESLRDSKYALFCTFDVCFDTSAEETDPLSTPDSPLIFLLKSTIFRVYQITFYTFKLMWETFQLSMCFMDAVEATAAIYRQNDRISNKAMNEILIHGGKNLQELIDSKKLLVQKLKKNRKTIENLCTRVNLGFNSDDLISVVEKSISQMEGAAPHIQAVFDKATNFLKASCYRLWHTVSGRTPPNALLPLRKIEATIA